MDTEEVFDNELWLIVTFFAQRRERFITWWMSLSEHAKRAELLEIGVSTPLVSVVSSSVLKCFEHYGQSANSLIRPPAADGILLVPPPDCAAIDQVDGLCSIVAALIEKYQVVKSDEGAQVLVHAASVAATSNLNQQRASDFEALPTLLPRYGVGDAFVAAIYHGTAARGPRAAGEQDQIAKVHERMNRHFGWMDPGPGKHAEECRSPTVAMTRGARLAAAKAIAVILKIVPPGVTAAASGDIVWPAGASQPTGQRLVDLAKCFQVLGLCVTNLDTCVLPKEAYSAQVHVAFQVVEAARTSKNGAVAAAVHAPTLGLFAGEG